MSNAYSADLRERVVAYVVGGGKKGEACRIFQIGHDTLYRWLRQYRETGRVAPRKRGKYTAWKLDEAALQQHLQTHADASVKELAAVFEVSHVAIWKAGRRLGISRKKTLRYRERDDAAREHFVRELAALPPA